MKFLEPAKAAPYYKRIAQFYEEVNNMYGDPSDGAEYALLMAQSSAGGSSSLIPGYQSMSC